jgi:hypothetical protein
VTSIGRWLRDSIKIAAAAFTKRLQAQNHLKSFFIKDTATVSEELRPALGPLIAAPPAIDHNGGILQVQVNFKSSPGERHHEN